MDKYYLENLRQLKRCGYTIDKVIDDFDTLVTHLSNVDDDDPVGYMLTYGDTQTIKSALKLAKEMLGDYCKIYNSLKEEE